jgi:hypothetical protein
MALNVKLGGSGVVAVAGLLVAGVAAYYIAGKVGGLSDSIGGVFRRARESASEALDSAGLYFDREQAVAEMRGEPAGSSYTVPPAPRMPWEDKPVGEWWDLSDIAAP